MNDIDIPKSALDEYFGVGAEITKDELEQYFRCPDAEAARIVSAIQKLCEKAGDRAKAITITGTSAFGEDIQAMSDKAELLARRVKNCQDENGLRLEIIEICDDLASRARLCQNSLREHFRRLDRQLKLIRDRCELLSE